MGKYSPLAILRMGADSLLRLYQKTLSPDHGWFRPWYPAGYCRFHPTCSQYARDVVQKKKIWIWFPLIVWRLMRCHPWAKGGEDPVV